MPSARQVRPDLPAAVERLLDRALAADPAARFPDAATFGAAIRNVLGDLSVAVGASDLAALLSVVTPPRRARTLMMERSKVIRLGPEAEALKEAFAAPATPAPVPIARQDRAPRRPRPDAAAEQKLHAGTDPRAFADARADAGARTDARGNRRALAHARADAGAHAHAAAKRRDAAVREPPARSPPPPPAIRTRRHRPTRRCRPRARAATRPTARPIRSSTPRATPPQPMAVDPRAATMHGARPRTRSPAARPRGRPARRPASSQIDDARPGAREPAPSVAAGAHRAARRSRRRCARGRAARYERSRRSTPAYGVQRPPQQDFARAPTMPPPGDSPGGPERQARCITRRRACSSGPSGSGAACSR